MQTFSKKFLAILLTLCMLASFAPMVAFAAEAEVVGQQLMLGDDLTMHFYVKTDAATATISVDGAERAAYTLSELTAGEYGYDLSVDLAAAEMTADIILAVNDGASNILSKTYSVQDYAHYLLENNYTAETKALAKEMLNYGAKAQLYFNHNTSDLANAGYEMETSAVIGTEVPGVEIADTISGVDYYGASMVFKSKIAVRFYFTGSSEGLSFSHGTPVQKGDQFYIEVADINPDQMDTALNISVTGNGGEISFSYSPMAYIIRMYNKQDTSSGLKALLAAANGYFQAAKIFTGVAQNRTGSLNFQYRYGANNLIQVNTNLPSDTPCVNFTASDNSCSIDQSANQYQQFGWAGMDNVDGTIVLTFHFGSAFEAGQTYFLPKGAVFGFTDNSKYTLDKNYTFTFDGSGWTMVAEEPAVSLSYRWGAGNLIQYNTNLPATTPLKDFLAGDNGCQITQSGDQQVGYISMANAEGTIVLTFNFNGAFEVGQSYTLSAGSLFGFTDGSKYELAEDITLYWTGSEWSAEAPVVETPVLNFLACSYGTSTVIQLKTDLPTTTPCVNFTAGQNGCEIDQSGNQYQQVGWIGMAQDDAGNIYLAFNFNSAFEAGQTYVLPKGAVFGFTDGSKYVLDKNYTFTFNGNSWDISMPEDPITMAYRWGNNNTIQYNTNLPASTPIANFLAGDNGCALIQNGQQVGWIGMVNAEGTIVLTFNFNGTFEVGQSYTLSAGSVFGFTDGSKYELAEDITLYWTGNEWAAEPPVPEVKNISLSYRWGAGNVIQYNTDLPATTPCADFTAGQNGCDLKQDANKYQQVGWIGMANVDGTIVLTFNFGSAFTAGQNYIIPAGSVFGFADGSSYTVPEDVILYFDGSEWDDTTPILLSYRWGNNNTIQCNTNLPATTPCASFLVSDNGCQIGQGGDQQVGWIGMINADGTIVLTFNFNGAFEVGQSYTLSAGSVFGFTDGSVYKLYYDCTLYWDGSAWTTQKPVVQDVLDAQNF